MTVQGELFPGEQKERYFHIYYSDYRKAKERAKLQKVIREQKECLEKYRGMDADIDSRYTEYFDLIYHTDKNGKRTLQFVREKQDIISRNIKQCGYFCIITSFEMTAADALDLYKSRDASEKLFRGDKSYPGERSMRVYRLDYAITATQKDILRAFNLTAINVKKEAGILGRKLAEYID